jgi:hypothetical protein
LALPLPEDCFFGPLFFRSIIETTISNVSMIPVSIVMAIAAGLPALTPLVKRADAQRHTDDERGDDREGVPVYQSLDVFAEEIARVHRQPVLLDAPCFIFGFPWFARCFRSYK